MELTAENVNNLFAHCLFKEGESTEKRIKVEGIMTTVGFHPERLKEVTSNIMDMLNNLPDNFKQSGGGGWSFLNMCQDKNNNQWTGFHKTMDELVMLGRGIGKLDFLLPRGLWGSLPGGMPYVVINENQNTKIIA